MAKKREERIMAAPEVSPDEMKPIWIGSILANINWGEVNCLVAREQKNRERFTPVISAYRWWARRPHGLIRAIIDAAQKNRLSSTLRISDPFSGGGTVAFEAVRKGLPIYAQDLYPWPSLGLAAALTYVSIPKFKKAAKDILIYLDSLRDAFRRSDGRELTHIIRVRVGTCPFCIRESYLFPDSLISIASRSITETQAYYGCQACGNVQLGLKDNAPRECSVCGSSLEVPLVRGRHTCPHCKKEAPQMQFLSTPAKWHPILVQEATTEQGRYRAKLRTVEPGDPVDSPPAATCIPEVRAAIYPGIETRRLLNAGFQEWGDLYTARQANIILSALSRITGLNITEASKTKLAYAVIGVAEIPAFISRWDRYHLKVFEGIANHRYQHTTIAVEINPLGELGRGTLARRFQATINALEWMLKEFPKKSTPKVINKVSSQEKLHRSVVIATGNSACQALPDSSTDLVLTDPLYFNDVQYGELSRIFHFWLSQFRELPVYNEYEEAVPNSTRKRDHKHYEIAVAQCLAESKRTLSPDGRLILTFHNRKIDAWCALSKALSYAGYQLQALAIARAENEADHSKRDGKGLLFDLVIECVADKQLNASPLPILVGNSTEEVTLYAMGCALSEALNKNCPELLSELFDSKLKTFGINQSLIR